MLNKGGRTLDDTNEIKKTLIEYRRTWITCSPTFLKNEKKKALKENDLKEN